MTMLKNTLTKIWSTQSVLLLVGFMALSVVVLPGRQASALACANPTPPPTTYGQVTQNVSVTSPGTYRVWSRIKAASSTDNSYDLQIDDGCTIVVGDSSSMPSGSWQWVNYQNGAAASVIDVTLTAGTHKLTYTGREPDVQLDRVLLLGDSACLPTGTGDNCVTTTVAPTIAITAPANNSSFVKGNAVNVTSSTSSSTVKVEYFVDGSLVNTDTTAPFSYVWTTTAATVGAHSITARAYDASGATGSSAPVTVNIVVGNTDTISPVVTTSVTPTTVAAGSAVTITGNATDNVGVLKVEFYADGALIGTKNPTAVGTAWAPTLSWTPTTAGAKSLTTIAYDAAGNHTTSGVVNLTVTPTTPTVEGDVNGDHHVNGVDYGVLIQHLNQSYPAGDFDHDGIITGADVAILMGHWTW